MPIYSLEQKTNFTASVRAMILIATMVSLVGCSSEKATDDTDTAKEDKKELTAKSVLVELAEVQRGMIEEVLERSSALEAEAQVEVLARTRNPAVELFVEEGDKVSKGQVLLRLENDRQQTDYNQALGQLEQARVDFERLDTLYVQQLVSESEYRDAKFALSQAQLRSENAKRELDYTEVRAPIDGTITSRTVKVGDSVGTGTPIFEIIDLESTVAVIHVPEQYIPKLKKDMEARMISNTLGEQVFAGFVKRISPVVEAQAGTIKVVVGVKELGALRPCMWVDVELVLDSKENALLIPKRAIVYDNDQTFAFKTYTDTNGVWRAKRQLVEPHNADKVHIEPGGGFGIGDEIVIAGQSGLKDESPIRELENPDASQVEPSDSIVQTNANSVPAAKKPAAQSGS
jgi:membrane fusion protein (multidrug efflux system)